MKIKKFDKLLVTSFIPPFIVTFFVAMFVFVMQTLWLYIDDIAGKGVGFFLLVELVSYMSVSMMPMALPVAVLISSVMVLGNMAERYELSSIKSAGVSLWRVMYPLMAVTMCIGLFSFFCSNYFIPVSNLKFKSRLYDIRKQKPTLSLEESVFNDDFQGFSIRLGNKNADGRSIEDVLLYDNSEGNQGRLLSVVADSGEMYGSPDGKYFVMHLMEGNQYMEPKPVTKAGKRNFPMVRTSFKEWTKVFDLDEFNLDRTDENLFKSHHTMLSNRQLMIAIDSINREIDSRIDRNAEQADKFFYFWEEARKEQMREQRRKEAEEDKKKDSSRVESPGKKLYNQFQIKVPDSSGIRKITAAIDSQKVAPKQDPLKIAAKPLLPARPLVQPSVQQIPNVIAIASNPIVIPQQVLTPDRYPQMEIKDLKEYQSIIQTFHGENWDELFEKAKNTARSLQEQAGNTNAVLVKTRESWVKHIFEYNTKFSMAVACFIFLFVGAPMGAIVRKGGFGWPLLISIIFFMLFIVITIFSKNIAERFVIDAVLASWMNCLIIFPMGLVLTWWAMHDVSMQQLAEYFKVKIPQFKRKA